MNAKSPLTLSETKGRKMSEIEALKKRIQELEDELRTLKPIEIDPWPPQRRKIHHGYRHKAKPGDPQPMWKFPYRHGLPVEK